MQRLLLRRLRLLRRLQRTSSRHHDRFEQLARAYRYGDDPTIILDTESTTKRMTADNVKASAKKFFDAKTYYEAVMLPENAAAAPAPAPVPAPAPAQK